MRVKSQPRHLPRREPTHSDTRKYVQQDDSKHFTSSKALTENSKEIHTDVRLYKCQTCDKTFQWESDLRRHERIHIDEKRYQCELCEKAFPRKWNLDQHKERCNGQNYKCIVCKKGFKTQQNLRHHVDTDHPRERLNKCNQCSAIFTHRQSLITHKKIHTIGKKYLCEVCGRAFQTKQQKDDHSLVHCDKKPHKCLMCGKTYTRRYGLLFHMRTTGHSNDTAVTPTT